MGALALTLVLSPLAGDGSFVAATREPLRIGGYTLLGPNLKKNEAIAIWIGHPPARDIEVDAVVHDGRVGDPYRSRNGWRLPETKESRTPGDRAYLSGLTGKPGRLIPEHFGFRLL